MISQSNLIASIAYQSYITSDTSITNNYPLTIWIFKFPIPMRLFQ